jgi:hypothetical protein
VDFRLIKCATHGGGDEAGTGTVTVNADRVVTTAFHHLQGLLDRVLRFEDRAGFVARREAAVRQHATVRKPFAISRNQGALRCCDDLETGLADESDSVSLGHSGKGIGGPMVVLAPAIEGAVRLDVREGSDCRQGADLKRDQRFDLGDGNWDLNPSEVRAVVIPRMRANLDAERPAAQHGGDADGNRAGMDAAPNAGAVNPRKDRLVLTGSLT